MENYLDVTLRLCAQQPAIPRSSVGPCPPVRVRQSGSASPSPSPPVRVRVRQSDSAFYLHSFI